MTASPPTDGLASGVLFVTGMQRAGTTLLEKLAAAHPRVSLLSQPLPLLFVELKRLFLHERGFDDPYPLGALFRERRYGEREWLEHLERRELDAAFLRGVFDAMDGYSGRYTRFAPGAVALALSGLVPGPLASVLAQLYRALAHKPGARLCGAKETLCEEYLPYLLAQGARAALILRDPRDVLASLNHGRGRESGGALKPTLFNLRNWRKSVAFAVRLEGRPGFAWLRYEDLVQRPRQSLDRLTGALGLEPLPASAYEEGLRDQSGASWRANSSHRPYEGLSSASVGSHRGLLPGSVARFTEAACYPELRLLGYPTSLRRQDVADVLMDFEDPYPLEREELREYATDPRHLQAEVERIDALGPADPGTEDGDFLFREVHRRLRAAL